MREISIVCWKKVMEQSKHGNTVGNSYSVALDSAGPELLPL